MIENAFWHTLFTRREETLITASRRFTKDLPPVALPSEEAMVIISKFADALDGRETLLRVLKEAAAQDEQP